MNYLHRYACSKLPTEIIDRGGQYIRWTSWKIVRLLSFSRRYPCISTCGSERERVGVSVDRRGYAQEWAQKSTGEWQTPIVMLGKCYRNLIKKQSIFICKKTLKKGYQKAMQKGIWTQTPNPKPKGVTKGLMKVQSVKSNKNWQTTHSEESKQN